MNHFGKIDGEQSLDSATDPDHCKEHGVNCQRSNITGIQIHAIASLNTARSDQSHVILHTMLTDFYDNL